MILTTILSKIGPFLSKNAAPMILAAACFGGGMVTMKKLTRDCPQVPACVCPACPEPTVAVQPFDVDKIKNLKSFTYSPTYSGSIQVAGVDSSSVRRWINQAVSDVLSDNKKQRRK